MSEKTTIEEVIARSAQKSNPVLLDFQNGKLTSASKESTLYFPVQEPKSKECGAVVIAGGSVYHGIVGEGYPTELMDSYVAVRNKATNKVRFVPIDQVSLKNNVYRELEQKTEQNILSNAASLNLLLKNFGGKKANRYLDRVEKMKINIDVVKDQLDKTVESAELKEEISDAANTEQNVAKIRPKFDKDAAKLQDVYNIFDVIPKDLLDRLNDEANAVLATDVANIPISSEYLLKRIEGIKNSPTKDSPSNILTVKIFLYMDALLALIKTRTMNLSKVELSKVTERVEEHIRANFSPPEAMNRIRTSFSTDKALCYFLVLALLTSDNYEIDLNTLTQELSIPKEKIIKFAHIVNAKVKAKTDLLSLRLPKSVKPMRAAFKRKRT